MRDNQFDWMRGTIYEPKAEHFLDPAKPPSRILLRIVCWILLALAAGAVVAVWF